MPKKSLSFKLKYTAIRSLSTQQIELMRQLYPSGSTELPLVSWMQGLTTFDIIHEHGIYSSPQSLSMGIKPLLLNGYIRAVTVPPEHRKPYRVHSLAEFLRFYDLTPKQYEKLLEKKKIPHPYKQTKKGFIVAAGKFSARKKYMITKKGIDLLKLLGEFYIEVDGRDFGKKGKMRIVYPLRPKILGNTSSAKSSSAHRSSARHQARTQ